MCAHANVGEHSVRARFGGAIRSMLHESAADPTWGVLAGDDCLQSMRCPCWSLATRGKQPRGGVYLDISMHDGCCDARWWYLHGKLPVQLRACGSRPFYPHP